MHAIIRTGGKQYRVQEGDYLNIEKLDDAEKGSAIVFDDVLSVGDGSSIKIGAPVVAGAKVKAKVVATGKAKKLMVFKKKRRKGYMVKRGHRQHFTRVQITGISG